jgi:hypothetical protein
MAADINRCFEKSGERYSRSIEKVSDESDGEVDTVTRPTAYVVATSSGK